MPQVQAACNVQIHLANAPVMLVSKVPPVIPCVGVTLLVPAERLVMRQLVSVLATQVTPEPHVTPVPPTTIGKVMELVQVRDILLRLLLCHLMFKISSYSQVAVVMPLDQAVYNVQIHLVNVPAKLVSRARHVTLLVVAILLAQVEQLVMHLLANVPVILVTQEQRAILAQQTTIEKVMELVLVSLHKQTF